MEFVSEQEILKAQEKVAQVDFSMQVSKMIEYNKLDKDYVMACMQQYKNFLVLQMVYKDMDFVPNGMIDLRPCKSKKCWAADGDDDQD